MLHVLQTPYHYYRAKHEMDRDEFMFFLTGGIGLENKLKNPASQWLSDKSWDEICRMCDLKGYKGTHTHCIQCTCSVLYTCILYLYITCNVVILDLHVSMFVCYIFRV